MNKHIILGGGIAGIALAIQLQKAGLSVKIFEKNPPTGKEGHAFILLPNGLNSLKKMGVLAEVMQAAHPIHNFRARTVSSDRHAHQAVPNSIGIRRKVLNDILTSQLLPDTIEYNKSFSHFSFSPTGEAEAAWFTDKTSVEGDVFIGADGIWSRTRSVVEPGYQLSPIRIREIVSVVKSPGLVQQLSHTFCKINQDEGGLAVGMLPCDQEHLVWYIQFDSHHPALMELTLEEQKQYLFDQIGKWPDPVPEIFAQTDFTDSYVWHTTDLDTLDNFYYKNVVLVGDAAHVFLTLTSQGVSAALEDAICLSDLLVQNRFLNRLETTLKQYSFLRKSIVDKYLKSGRTLKTEFLSPVKKQSTAKIPLVMS